VQEELERIQHSYGIFSISVDSCEDLTKQASMKQFYYFNEL
jgi:hypothetical protein